MNGKRTGFPPACRLVGNRSFCVFAGLGRARGGFADALLLEFGERGWRSYSAYSLVSGVGTGDGFTWTDPAPAGEVSSLL